MAETTAGRVPAVTPSARARARRRGLTRDRLRWLLIVVGPLIALLGVGYFYFTGGRYIATDDAYVRAETVNLSTDVSGLVAQILVHDNQKVSAGQPLFRLDDGPFRIALANAQAQLGVVANDIAALQASWRQKLADITLARQQLVLAGREYERQKTLASHSFASQQALDQARKSRDAAQGNLASLEQQQAGIAAQLSGDPALPVERQPRYLAALAQVDLAKRNLRDTVVRAPMPGFVTNVPSLTPGSYLAAGTTGFNLVALHRLWVEADPKETELTHAAPGQRVVITADTYPGVEWQGTLESLSPASASAFSLLPAQNTSGNWVKVVQRIPVRIAVDDDPAKPALRSGMSVEVSIDTGRYRRLPHFLASLLHRG